jgi:hypothetical protein
MKATTFSRRCFSFFLGHGQRRAVVGKERATSIITSGSLSSSFSCSPASLVFSLAFPFQSKAALPVGPCRPGSLCYSFWSSPRRGPSQDETTTTTAPSIMLMRRAPHESCRSTTESAKTDGNYYSGAITATTTTLLLASDLLGYGTSSSNSARSVIEVDREEEEEEEEGEEDYDSWTLHGPPPTVTHSDEGRQLWDTTTDSGSVTMEHVDMLESLEGDDMIIEPRMGTASANDGGGYSSINLPEVTMTAFGNDWDDDTNVVLDGCTITTTTTTIIKSESAWITSSSSGNERGVLENSSWPSSSGRDEDYCDEEY